MLAMLLFAFVWIVLYAGLFAVVGPALQHWARSRAVGRSGPVASALVAAGATVGAFVLFTTFGTVTTGSIAQESTSSSAGLGPALWLVVDHVVSFVLGVAASIVGGMVRGGRL
ncbi:MAG: hypothetical protein AAGE94_01930 [Acidobacteriota bacterium]